MARHAAPGPGPALFSGVKKGSGRGEHPAGAQHSSTPNEDVRRRPTLPHPPECSTIGAIELSFRVRNGTGRFLDAMTAVTQRDSQPAPNTPPTPERDGQRGGVVPREPHSGRKHSKQPTHTKNVEVSLRPLVPVSSTHYCASTSGLSTQSSTGGLTHPKGARISHLEAGFPLRCFQRLSLPDVANQPCSWQNNWHTRGQSIPVLSY